MLKYIPFILRLMIYRSLAYNDCHQSYLSEYLPFPMT